MDWLSNWPAKFQRKATTSHRFISIPDHISMVKRSTLSGAGSGMLVRTGGASWRAIVWGGIGHAGFPRQAPWRRFWHRLSRIRWELWRQATLLRHQVFAGKKRRKRASLCCSRRSEETRNSLIGHIPPMARTALMAHTVRTHLTTPAARARFRDPSRRHLRLLRRRHEAQLPRQAQRQLEASLQRPRHLSHQFPEALLVTCFCDREHAICSRCVSRTARRPLPRQVKV